MSDFNDPLDITELGRALFASAPKFASPEVEERLRLACRARRSRQVRRRQRRWAAAALAACLLLALAWQFSGGRREQQVQTPSYAGFLALPYAESDVPIERASVVPVELSPGDLKALGLPSRLITGRERRRADLLVGQDGVARAVRISQ